MSGFGTVKYTGPDNRRRIHTHEDGLGLTELCVVYANDAPHALNGANHSYTFERLRGEDEPANDRFDIEDVEGKELAEVGYMEFQNGPRHAPDSIPGTLDGAVIAMEIDRMEGFQRGPFACESNEQVLAHLRAALEILKSRARERAARGVLGKNEK